MAKKLTVTCQAFPRLFFFSSLDHKHKKLRTSRAATQQHSNTQKTTQHIQQTSHVRVPASCCRPNYIAVRGQAIVIPSHSLPSLSPSSSPNNNLSLLDTCSSHSNNNSRHSATVEATCAVKVSQWTMEQRHQHEVAVDDLKIPSSS